MDNQLTLDRGNGGLALALGMMAPYLLELGAMVSSTTMLEMVLATPPGIHRFSVQLSNITNKHLKHVGKAT
jgi:hypothetical protein